MERVATVLAVEWAYAPDRELKDALSFAFYKVKRLEERINAGTAVDADVLSCIPPKFTLIHQRGDLDELSTIFDRLTREAAWPSVVAVTCALFIQGDKPAHNRSLCMAVKANKEQGGTLLYDLDKGVLQRDEDMRKYVEGVAKGREYYRAVFIVSDSRGGGSEPETKKQKK